MNIQIEIPEELKQELTALRNELAEIKTNFKPKEPPRYLTKNETAELLKVDLSTLYNWQKKGVLLPIQIGGRVYYKADDIEAAFVQLKK